jgi:hypothetical protein
MNLRLSRSTRRLNAMVWKGMLGTSQSHRNTELLYHAAGMVWRLDSMDAVPYVLLSSLYLRARRCSRQPCR